jgi:hypothetical protein
VGLRIVQQAVLRPVALLVQSRIESETPSFAAFTLVAPGVRLSAFAILITPDFALAIVSLFERRPSSNRVEALSLLSPFLLQIVQAIPSTQHLRWRAMNKHCCYIVERGAAYRYSHDPYFIQVSPWNELLADL